MRNPVLPRGARPSGDRPRGGVQGYQCPRVRNPVLPRGARPSGDRPHGGVQRSQCFKAQKCETLYSPARPSGDRPRGGVQGYQCFKARKCETLYSPAGPVRAVTGPAGEYRVLNVLRPISGKPCTPPRGPSDRRHIFLFAKGKIRSGPRTKRNKSMEE